MFGHLDDEQNNSDHTALSAPPAPANIDGVQAPTGQPTPSKDHDDSSVGYLDHLTSESPDDDDTKASQPSNNSDGASDANVSDDSSSDSSNDSSSSDDASAPLADDKLLDIKKQALGELSPLVSHLDQSPEEKFKTTMMMIQAADNQALIPEAYAAAKDISDEKARAQALLDIVNEINYFTHKN